MTGEFRIRADWAKKDRIQEVQILRAASRTCQTSMKHHSQAHGKLDHESGSASLNPGRITISEYYVLTKPHI